jgi:hypothetical protein
MFNVARNPVSKRHDPSHSRRIGRRQAASHVSARGRMTVALAGQSGHLTASSLARSQGRRPPGSVRLPARPRDGRSSRKTSTGRFLIAHHPPRADAFATSRPERRWEGLNHKAPSSSVAASTRRSAAALCCEGRQRAQCRQGHCPVARAGCGYGPRQECGYTPFPQAGGWQGPPAMLGSRP